MKATPLSDGWRQRTMLALQKRGRRAALARALAQGYGGEEKAWSVQLARVLNQGVRIDSEIMLAVDAWLAAPSLRKDSPPPARQTVGPKTPKNQKRAARTKNGKT